MVQKSALEHLADKAAEIQDNPTGKYDCTMVAREMQRVLEAEGKLAEVMRFAILNQYGEPQLPIKPVRFPGRNWDYHDVCCFDDQIYDPLMAETPIYLEKYSSLVFGTEIPFQTEDEVGKLFENAANRGFRS